MELESQVGRDLSQYREANETDRDSLGQIARELVSYVTNPAGLSLFPVAAFLLWVGTRRDIPRPGAWLAILGNVGWIAGNALPVTWEMVDVRDGKLRSVGTEFLLLAADGRIRQDYQFIEPGP